MTKKEMFAEIRNRVADNAEMVAFIDHEIELLSRKRTSSKPTKNQVANQGIKGEILAILDKEKGLSATEIANLVGNGVSCQKASALLRQMVAEGSVARATEGDKAKGKTLFTLA